MGPPPGPWPGPIGPPPGPILFIGPPSSGKRLQCNCLRKPSFSSLILRCSSVRFSLGTGPLERVGSEGAPETGQGLPSSVFTPSGCCCWFCCAHESCAPSPCCCAPLPGAAELLPVLLLPPVRGEGAGGVPDTEDTGGASKESEQGGKEGLDRESGLGGLKAPLAPKGPLGPMLE